MSWPIVPPLELISERLPLIFPEGSAHRNYVIREMAAKTVFTLLYVGAVDGLGRYARPSQITDMTDAQSLLTEEGERVTWVLASMKTKKERPAGTWYAANSREPIRDETLRMGFIPSGAVVELTEVPTTSSKPRYALGTDFVSLFDPTLIGQQLDQAIDSWQRAHLSAAAMGRLHLVRKGATRSKDAVVVTCPNGDVRAMKAGKSSQITKAVVEEYAIRFLKNPVVLWLSESGNKVLKSDDELARALNIHIDPSKVLPDVILVDLGENPDGSGLAVVFVEVVASDGPVDVLRKKDLSLMATEAGFDPASLKFLTAYWDRGTSEFRKTVSDLAWNTAAWFASEPDNIVELLTPNA